MSWEATCWVQERSKAKGGDLLCMFIIGNHMNGNGYGWGPSVDQLAHAMRVNRTTVQRICRRLERCGELVCTVRGSGRRASSWSMPGVVTDGFSTGGRGRTLPPQGRRIAIPGAAKRRPRGGEMQPNPFTTPKPSLVPVVRLPPPPPEAAEAAAQASPSHPKEAPPELKAWLRRSDIHLDSRGADRLWVACRARVPSCTPLEVEWACQHKLERSRGARNLAGLIIATVPDLLAEEIEAEMAAQGLKNNT